MRFICYNISVARGGSALRYTDVCSRLQKCGIENYAQEAAILIEEICGELSDTEDYPEQALEDAIVRRCSGYPLQYIIGKWWFCRCEFEVNESCLVPRPDTECVVEEAVRLLPQGARFADLCTGSGCIAISLLDLRQDLSAIAVELYPKTLEVAKRNAEKNCVFERLSFILGDVLSGAVLPDCKLDAIISNPPYIKSSVVDSLSGAVTHEPRAALDGGDDGLVFYRAIIEKYADKLKEDGCFIFEIGYDQKEDICIIAQENGFLATVKKDLGGNDRVAVLKRKLN